MPLEIRRSAVLSRGKDYRYALYRFWRPGPVLRVGMLNPSKADAETDDHTIRKLYGFAERLGCGSVAVWNLYAFRATKPADLWKAADPIGPDNDAFIATQLAKRGMHVVAWGAHARPDRVESIRTLLTEWNVRPMCWGMTKAGAPRHPLMLPYETRLRPWGGYD